MGKQEACRIAKTLVYGRRGARLGPKHGIRDRARGGVAWWGALLFAAATTARAEWSFDVDTGVLYDSNASRASNGTDVRSDAAATLAIAATSPLAPNESDRVTFGAGAGGDVHLHYRGLDDVSVVGTAAYRHKFGLGFTAPWLRIDAGAGYYTYDTHIRTGPQYVLRAAAGKRLSETFDVESGIFYDRRYSPYAKPDVPGISGNVFNLRGYGAYVSGGYAMTESLLVSAKAAIRRGDVVSTSSEAPRILSIATAIAEDPTFGDELYDYRLRGTTRTGAVTASWALNDRSSINLIYTGEHTSVADGLAYHTHVINLIFAYGY